MVLNQLKQIRDELKTSAEAYDRAFKNTALIAAKELVDQSQEQNNLASQDRLNSSNGQTKQAILKSNSNQQLNKQYFIEKYGSLKEAKAAYKKIYGEQRYGRSWSDFISIAQKLSDTKSEKSGELSLSARITKIENFLQSLGYQL